MDPVELPPNAVLDAPLVNGKPIARWEQLIDAGKRERNLILKISGFHESAGGARSVVLGSDSSLEEWEEVRRRAVSMASTSLHILQVYKKAEACCASSLLGGGLGGIYGGSCAFMPVLFCR